LVLEYDSSTESKTDESNKNNMGTENDISKPLQIKTDTKYYLMGEAQLTIEVQQPNPDKPEPNQKPI
jgi:hypothetical protein